jgi:hypothetical protein
MAAASGMACGAEPRGGQRAGRQRAGRRAGRVLSLGGERDSLRGALSVAVMSEVVLVGQQQGRVGFSFFFCFLNGHHHRFWIRW